MWKTINYCIVEIGSLHMTTINVIVHKIRIETQHVYSTGYFVHGDFFICCRDILFSWGPVCSMGEILVCSAS